MFDPTNARAQESFYSKLKTFGDETNTNLYVSNLPKSMNEHELAQLFSPHKVCSTRILRHKNGLGRGVGFARYVGGISLLFASNANVVGCQLRDS